MYDLTVNKMIDVLTDARDHGLGGSLMVLSIGESHVPSPIIAIGVAYASSQGVGPDEIDVMNKTDDEQPTIVALIAPRNQPKLWLRDELRGKSHFNTLEGKDAAVYE